jgi:hypothetical protein
LGGTCFNIVHVIYVGITLKCNQGLAEPFILHAS